MVQFSFIKVSILILKIKKLSHLSLTMRYVLSQNRSPSKQAEVEIGMQKVYWKACLRTGICNGRSEIGQRQGWAVVQPQEGYQPFPQGALKLKWPCRVVQIGTNEARCLYFLSNQPLDVGCSQEGLRLQVREEGNLQKGLSYVSHQFQHLHQLENKHFSPEVQVECKVDSGCCAKYLQMKNKLRNKE